MPETSSAYGKRIAAFDYNTTSSTHIFGGSLVSATEYPTVDSTTVAGTAPNATVNFNADRQSVLYLTQNAGANWTLNFRGTAAIPFNAYIAQNEMMTLVLMATQGATAYYPSTIQIDGTAVTPKWQGGTAPTAGNASAIDVYIFTITKTANATFVVLAAQTQFK